MRAMNKSRLVELHRSHWQSVWIWTGYLCLFVGLQVALMWTLIDGPGWLAAVLMLGIAHVMHVHLIAFHEAAHGSLCPNRRINDGLGVLIGTFSFMSVSLYRAVHYSHHVYLSTVRDEELWPFVIPGTPRGSAGWPRHASCSWVSFTRPSFFSAPFFARGRWCATRPSD